MVNVRQAYPGEFGRIAAFYRHLDYAPTLAPDDIIVLAEHGGELCGAVRICEEHGALLLRGMRVREGVRGQGIGTRLLEAVEPFLGGRECFCIPLRYLGSFYGRIGFSKIAPATAPPFLRERCEKYRREYGLDVIIMRKAR